MKTIKIFASLCILFCFTANSANAQPVRIVNSWSFTFDNFSCFNEPVLIESTWYCSLIWRDNGGVTHCTEDGTLTVLSTGIKYTYSGITNLIDANINNNFTQSILDNRVIRLENKVVGYLHFNFVVTSFPDRERNITIENMHSHCNLD